jgi:hypothetical protein
VDCLNGLMGERQIASHQNVQMRVVNLLHGGGPLVSGMPF